jgi:hypothetical protein
VKVPRELVLAAAVAVVAAGAAHASVGAKTLALKPGDGIAVAGTDLVCAFGGPANHVGLACLHGNAKAKAPYSFRLDEAQLVAFRTTNGHARRVGLWREPAGRIAQPRSHAVSQFKLVAELGAGKRFAAAGTDLQCSVYAFHGAMNVACFKLDAKGIAERSYAAALSATALQVSRFHNGHGTTVLVGTAAGVKHR